MIAISGMSVQWHAVRRESAVPFWGTHTPAQATRRGQELERYGSCSLAATQVLIEHLWVDWAPATMPVRGCLFPLAAVIQVRITQSSDGPGGTDVRRGRCLPFGI